MNCKTSLPAVIGLMAARSSGLCDIDSADRISRLQG